LELSNYPFFNIGKKRFVTRRCLFLCCALFSLAVPLFAREGNTVLGYSGLLLIPTAELAADGDVAIGVCRIPKLYADHYKPYDRTVFYANMGYTSFFEVTFGIVRPDHFPGGVGDRTVAARVLALKETRYTPAVAVGVHDFFAVEALDLEPPDAQHFTTSYLVSSKTFKWPQNMRAAVHLGYAFDILPSNDRHLDGWFGGAAFSPLPSVELILEHDSRHINGGVRFFFFSRLEYMISFWQMRFVMHNLSFSLPLL
jgi:hypothetical protein